ncbi:hypothetical protein ACFO1B_54495 [Dactylosporangium siamense]|uniref:Uncharacterized protein n=1 Tax=Dactylosporangium siamense TaxID=685454 RepID=A0A919Q124_9ACTN|nr:hypothetical protein [Dactylosporangium siamense]GIG52941.1 hypothetical protein Dsi01nite_109820 [Dactylosporangium siamense]
MRIWRLTVAALVAGAAVTVPVTPAHAAVSDAELAYRWAPVHYQDTASSYRADYLAPVDYDGDWNTLDNWNDLDANPQGLTGTSYYSVVETGTHWFIVYAFYHPRDWKTFFPHENDMEGLLLTVRKDGGTGVLEAMITLAHDNFYSYVPAGSPYTGNRENIDGSVLTQVHDGAAHPTTFQEAKGHGCYNWSGGSFPGGDGVVYYPSRDAGTVPANRNDRAARYRLVDLFGPGGLWQRRDSNPPFGEYGAFAGDDYQRNAAHTPWAWDDKTDGSDLQAGVIATDPAYLVSQYFTGLGAFSLTYVRNTYRG